MEPLDFKPNKEEKKKKNKLNPNFSIGKNIWILKPTMLNRGIGIHLFTDISELETLIIDYCKGVQEKKPKSKKNRSPEVSPLK